MLLDKSRQTARKKGTRGSIAAAKRAEEGGRGGEAEDENDAGVQTCQWASRLYIHARMHTHRTRCQRVGACLINDVMRRRSPQDHKENGNKGEEKNPPLACTHSGAGDRYVAAASLDRRFLHNAGKGAQPAPAWTRLCRCV